MIDWYKKVMFENYANFSGRARRSEYWNYILMNILILMFLIISFAVVSSYSESLYGVFISLLVLYLLIIIIPSLAVIVRRLHDINKSGWYFFIRFIPLVGPLWLLVLLCTDGTQGYNNYGKDPKEVYDDINEIGQKSFD